MKSLNRKLKALFVLLSFAAYMPISALPSLAAIDANTTPDLNSSINGGYVGINKGDNNKFDVNINAKPGGVAQFDWNSFNVGSNITVDWIFNNPNQTAVNRVLNSGGMSQIYGKLTSSCASGSCGHNKSGNVILINPNGILFGAGSSVNLNSFTASTKDIKGMQNIQDIISSGNYLGGKLQQSNIAGSQGKNYTFTGDDKLTMNYKWGNTIAFDKQTTIDNYGNGIIGKVGQITLDGTEFNSGFNSKGEPTTNATLVALIGDKIDVKNSKIQTFVPNEGTSTNNNWGVARSDVKIITADGVNFVYESIGSIDESGTKIVEKAINKADADKYGINIDNSRIWTGNVQLNDAVQYSNLVINHSQIFGDKISDNVAGMIAIKGLNDVIIKDSQIETVNPNGNVENLDNYYGLRYGDIEVRAGNNIIIENSGIQSVGSKINDYVGNKKVGNIDLIADNGIKITSDKQKGSFNGKEYHNHISAGGDLNIDAGLTDVVIDVVKGSLVDGLKDVNISGRNVAIKGANVTGDKITVKAGWVDSYKNLPSSDAHGAYGSIVIDDAVLATKGGANEINILGLNSTIKDTALIYNNLNFYNATTNANGNNNNVLLKDGTTILDRTASATNPLTIETNGMLVIDHNQLQQKDYYDALATNQNSDIVLKSVNDLVSIRNNSNIVTSGNITLDAAKSASISTSDVTAGKNIVMHGKSGVTIGDVIEQQAGDTNVITKKGSNLNAANGTITLTADGAVANDIKGVTIIASNLTSKANTITAKNGKVAIQANANDTVKSTIKATAGNNTISATNGDLVIDKADIIASADNTLTSTNVIGIQNGSNVTAGGKNDITANGIVIVRDASQVTANGNNNITSNNAKVRIEGAGTKVESTNANVNITQYETALLDKNYTGTIKAKNNIALNVTGKGNNIEGSSLGQFQYGGRLKLDAENNINLTKTSGDWTISKVDLNSKENTIKAETGNVTINNDITLGDKTNKTTIKAGRNVKTNGVINANKKKLIVNAGKEIDIAFTGVSNKTAGLEINSDVNTSGVGGKNQQENNSNLTGKNVKLTAQDGNLTIAKIKADRLEIANPETTKIAAATDGKAVLGFDNISNDNKGTANVGTAYVEVRELAGWNMDTDINNIDAMPGFYQENYDQIDGVANRHKISFEDGNSILLVYTRTTDCEEPILPVTPPGNVDNALTESTVVRLPRHEEGVSAVAPVLNEITDPTANIIMAAARLALDEENEEDEDKF